VFYEHGLIIYFVYYGHALLLANSVAETEYKFENGKLSYLNYYDNSLGFYTVATLIG